MKHNFLKEIFTVFRIITIEITYLIDKTTVFIQNINKPFIHKIESGALVRL